jgi:hypothetical protein
MSFCGALGAWAVYHHQWIQLLSDGLTERGDQVVGSSELQQTCEAARPGSG